MAAQSMSQPKPTKPRTKAKQVIKLLSGRKGFDWWWDDIQEEDQKEILDELTKLLS